MSHPANIARLIRQLEDPVEARPVDAGWTVVRASPTDAVAHAVADAFSGEVDEVGDEYDSVKAIGRPGGSGILVVDASLSLLMQGEIIGVCLVQEFDNVPEVSWLCTARSMRRRGVAEVLLASSLLALRQAEFSQVVLFVDRANQPALRLYERFGFAESQPPEDGTAG
ncbi:MAG: GNAT family N-acetyltransferase [Candidatus Dormibacter sp.]